MVNIINPATLGSVGGVHQGLSKDHTCEVAGAGWLDQVPNK